MGTASASETGASSRIRRRRRRLGGAPLFGVIAAFLLVALWVLPRAVSLARQALRILSESSPSHIDVDALRTALENVEGVTGVHDLHVWTLVPGKDMATAHLTSSADSARVLESARAVLSDRLPSVQWTTEGGGEGGSVRLVGRLAQPAINEIQSQALKQNIETLHKRVNELGVAEPVIQQQGANRIVVQLPGVQDTAKAKDIIGRTATLQFRLVEPDSGAAAETVPQRLAPGETVPRTIGLKRDVIATGEHAADTANDCADSSAFAGVAPDGLARDRVSGAGAECE